MLSHFSCAQLFETLWTVTCQAPLSMGFPRQNTGVGCHTPLQGNLPNPGIELMSLMSPVLASEFFTTSATWQKRKWQPTLVFLPRESCGQRSQVGCTELDTTEVTYHACMHWRRKWQPTPVFSQGRRSLLGC